MSEKQSDNDYPIFMATDASSYEDTAFPIAIAWSLPDGQIKSSLIKTEDHWHDPHANFRLDFDLDDETLQTQGRTVLEIIREMDTDIDQGYVYTLDPDMNDYMALRLYDCYDMEPPFESYTTEDVLPTFDAELLFEQMEVIGHNLGIDTQSCENRVRILLEIIHQQRKMQLE